MKTRLSYPSSSGRNTIAAYVYKPGAAQCARWGGRPRAVVQISHGMCEYLERYADFAGFLNDQGILVCGNDHLGHGDSVNSEEDYGYFAETDGWKCLVEDVHRLTLLMKADYPDTPYFLLGHSMGSFVARAYLSKYGDELSGAVIMGTSGTNRLAPLAYPLVTAMKKTRGDRYRSKAISGFAFGTYNAEFKPHRTEYDWISNDERVVDRYNADPRCTFLFTLSGFLDLYHMLDFISRREWAESVSAELPVLLLSGDMDPVGNHGRGVKEVHDRLAFAGLKDLIMKLYPDCRHELLNETNREQVYADILTWLNKRCMKTSGLNGAQKALGADGA